MAMKLSIVVPVFNEEESLDELFNRSLNALERITPSFELILVNDGSSDNSLEIIKAFHEKDKRYKVIDLSRNFGHQSAVLAGISHASGEYVGVMDADLQDPPELFQEFLDKAMKDGFDVVYGVRKKRKEGWLKKMGYLLYYRLLTRIANLDLPLDSGDFCLMHRRVVDEILSMPEQSLYIRGIRHWVGFRQVGLPYDRPERFAGDTKYSFRALFKLAYDGIFSFSDFPIRFMGQIGTLTIIISLLYTIFILSKKLIWGDIIEGFTTLILAIFFFGGVQLLSISILGEYISRTYDESRKRPLFIVKETLL